MFVFTPNDTVYSLVPRTQALTTVASLPSPMEAQGQPSAWPRRWDDLRRLLDAPGVRGGDTMRLSRISALGGLLTAALEGDDGRQVAQDLADLPEDQRSGWIAALVLAGYQEPGGTREALEGSPAVQACRSAQSLATAVNGLLRDLLGDRAFQRLREGPHRSTLCTYVMLEALGPGRPLVPRASIAAVTWTPPSGLESSLSAAARSAQTLRRAMQAARAAWEHTVQNVPEPQYQSPYMPTTSDFRSIGVAVRGDIAGLREPVPSVMRPSADPSAACRASPDSP
ncbi:hypothetical protein [Roseateles sp. L2-2]|uniref:hypothetical protein n=1 Tax=Roseateles TaxID=93681 RepID=UPI003D36DA42